MHTEKMKEVFKKAIEKAEPKLSLAIDKGEWDQECFKVLTDSIKALEGLESIELMEDGKEAFYDYMDEEDERDGKRIRVGGYYRNAKRRRRDSRGRYRNGKIVVKDTYDYMPDGTYGLNGLDYEQIDEYNRTPGMRKSKEYDYNRQDDYDGSRDYRQDRQDRNYNTGSMNRNYRFKMRTGENYDTEIEEEVYKILEKNQGREEEVLEKIINILAEPIQDMKVLYPKLFEKTINKIKVMDK